MGATKLNCWEYMKCGREPGGHKHTELGSCPAASDTSFDGINSGKNAGRICWAVAGTCCAGEVHGTYAQKRASCVACDFYKLVQEEERTAKEETNLLGLFSYNEDSPILKELTIKVVKAGKRFITQGKVQDQAYIIQRGSCLVIVENDGQLYPVDHRGRGKHIHFFWENWTGFHGFFGFLGCVFLVLAAKQLRKILMRGEDFYD